MDIIRTNQINTRIVKPITEFTKQVPGQSQQSRKKRLSNRKIHDLTALIYVHYSFINSPGIKNARYGDLKVLLERTKRSASAYNKQEALKAVYKYFEKLVDFIS